MPKAVLRSIRKALFEIFTRVVPVSVLERSWIGGVGGRGSAAELVVKNSNQVLNNKHVYCTSRRKEEGR